MKKILLNMIVKNEAKIITRLLNSVDGVIDALVICDTGSSDDTVKIIQNWANSKSISYKVIQDKWVNFGINRTNAIDYAKEFLTNNNSKHEDWYLLFLDADMELIIDSSFDKKNLNQQVYSLKQFNQNSFEYFNIRMARADVSMQYECPTHEYLDVGNVQIATLNSLRIKDIGDGGAKSDKFERDIKLLTEALESEPENPRYLFYLANSYFDIGDYNHAKKWYQARCNVFGWDEERWYAKYKWGLCLLRLSSIQDAEKILLEAFQQRLWRAEPIFALAQYYHQQDDHIRAYTYALLASKLDTTKQDRLFIDKNANGGNGPIEIISIHAYYIGLFEEGLHYTKKLISAFPEIEQHKKNLQIYINSL
ncbi:tetratricopeptide repeat-containing glycosyltransferase [Flavobacterium ginsenosidimutans]|uniref:tetratricopeptide repeat-containing glycosyltransferase n=1 Tax=Flavobacterium ginsenosidimutans TaxID=687844 RepID=UPI000DABB747|nr:glycosyltransferase [Flavobacterium ginsenosidimutans]KAF2335386.1 glycosyltransferase [Flavobacterium ginsenosidimutans]